MKIKIPTFKLTSESNSGENRYVKAARHKRQKFFTTIFMKKIDLPTLPCRILLTRFSPLQYDDDNIVSAFKYVRDAISEYILGEIDQKKYKPGRADNDNRISWEYAQEKTKDGEYYITIEIYPMDTPIQA